MFKINGKIFDKSIVIKSKREKELIESMECLISFYGYIVLPVGLLRNLQWSFLKESFDLKAIEINGVDFYRVQNYERKVRVNE